MTGGQLLEKSALADRRGFLKWAAAAAIVADNAKAAPATPPKAAKATLYRESEHIRRYYELLR